MKNNNKGNKIIDVIIFLFLLALVAVMVVFTLTRGTDKQQSILMEIYKSGGTNGSNSMDHYYIYSNTNIIKIRNFNSGTNAITTKEISQNLIDNFKQSLDEYITQKPYIHSNFYQNERYTIEYNGASLAIPNPSIATALGYDASEYSFYNIIDNFINSIKN